MAERVSLKEAAERVGVSPETLRRWAREGVIPELNGTGQWTTAAVAHARIVARLRERGHKLEHIKEAGRRAGSPTATSRRCSAATSRCTR